MYCNPAYDKLVADALKELDFNKRLTLLHDAERIALKDAPYLITDHDNVVAVTYNDTWTGYVPQPSGPGAPFGYSWLQLQLIKKAAAGGAARTRASSSPSPAVSSRWSPSAPSSMRRREKAEPVELEQD